MVSKTQCCAVIYEVGYNVVRKTKMILEQEVTGQDIAKKLILKQNIKFEKCISKKRKSYINKINFTLRRTKIIICKTKINTLTPSVNLYLTNLIPLTEVNATQTKIRKKCKKITYWTTVQFCLL